MFRHIERTDPITLMERTVRWWTEQSPWGQKDWSTDSAQPLSGKLPLVSLSLSETHLLCLCQMEWL